MSRGSLNETTARAFLDRLAGEADADHTYQIIPSADGKVGPSVVHGRLSRLRRSLSVANAHGAGIAVRVNDGEPGKRGEATVTRVRALFADLDGADPAPLFREEIKPHFVHQTSPGRVHAFWLVHEFPKWAFRAAQIALAVRFGGDTTVCDLSRVMRLPGSYNMKGGGFPVWTMVSRYAEAFSLEEMLEGMPFLAHALEAAPCGEALHAVPDTSMKRLPAVPRATRLSEHGGNVVSVEDIVHGVAEAIEGRRHTTLFRNACVLGARAAMGLMGVEVAFNALVEAGIRSGLSHTESERTARDGLARGASEVRGRDVSDVRRGFPEGAASGIRLPCLSRETSMPNLDDCFKGPSWD